jgi:hypothetical protein
MKRIIKMTIFFSFLLVLMNCKYFSGVATLEYFDNRVFKLRDIGPGGGFVFYDKGYYTDDWRYLEAAPVSTQGLKPWGINGILANANIWDIGAGKNNTALIIASLSGTSNTAAHFCDSLSFGGYNDWFLPSREELNKMWINLKRGTNDDEGNPTYTPVGNFDSFYWSSTENDAGSARYQNLSDGAWSLGSKAPNMAFRAVRRF